MKAMRAPSSSSRLIFVAVVLTMALCLTLRTSAQDAASSDPVVGTWKLDLAKSVMNRAGGAPAHPTRPATRIFAVEGDGYRMSVLDDGAGGAARAYFARFDGKEYPDPHGPGKGEIAIHWRLSPYLIVRLVKMNGMPTEYATYAVSADGNVLTTTSWDPATPEYHNVQVYERQK
jgi:hypothetical protein